MEGLLPIIYSILSVLILVVCNGIFVAAEFALVRTHPTKLKSPELQSAFGTRSALILLENIDRTLSTTQLAITTASLVIGWWGEQVFASFFFTVFSGLGDSLSFIASHGTATILALLVVTSAHVVIGELFFKSIAIRFPETTVRILAPLVLSLSKIFRPFIFLLNKSAKLLLSLFGLEASPETDRIHSTGELSMLISQSTEYGVLDKSEEEMLKGIFGFSETVAREVMTPRTDMITVPVKVSFEEALKIVNSSGFSRFPVIGDNVDDIKGILLARDLLSQVSEQIRSQGKNFSVTKIMREPYFIPGTKPIDDLLNELKRRKIHFAIVLDEHGGVDGAVTLEDLLEEIVGDIYDESDLPDNEVVIEDSGEILVDGGLLVADVNDRFHLSIPEGDYDTVAGFIFSILGRMSRSGDSITLRNSKVISVNGILKENDSEITSENGSDSSNKAQDEIITQVTLMVERVSGNRIETVRLTKELVSADSDSPISEDESEKQDLDVTENG